MNQYTQYEYVRQDSLGILIKATQQEVVELTEADALHARMIDEGYRSPLSYENVISCYLND